MTPVTSVPTCSIKRRSKKEKKPVCPRSSAHESTFKLEADACHATEKGKVSKNNVADVDRQFAMMQLLQRVTCNNQIVTYRQHRVGSTLCRSVVNIYTVWSDVHNSVCLRSESLKTAKQESTVFASDTKVITSTIHNLLLVM